MAKIIWSHEVYEAITLGDWHLFDCLVSRKIYLSTFFKFVNFYTTIWPWMSFGLFILWINWDEAFENASCKLFDEVRRHEELTQYWAQKSSYRQLRFWISTQVLITKSLCADLQITPRFYPRLTRSFKSKHWAWILKVSLPNSIPRTPGGTGGGCVEIKKLSAGVIFGVVQEGNGPGACLRSPSHCQCVVVCLSWHMECQQQPGPGPPCSQSRAISLS